mmetsp:Transcript_14938/g.19198  ORF Transcript_14938/g.19198 Transcript_14938/m.19198 type:complete len:123 (-) Transcript_14938:166-534(-)
MFVETMTAEPNTSKVGMLIGIQRNLGKHVRLLRIGGMKGELPCRDPGIGIAEHLGQFPHGRLFADLELTLFRGGAVVVGYGCGCVVFGGLSLVGIEDGDAIQFGLDDFPRGDIVESIDESEF